MRPAALSRTPNTETAAAELADPVDAVVIWIDKYGQSCLIHGHDFCCMTHGVWDTTARIARAP